MKIEKLLNQTAVENERVPSFSHVAADKALRTAQVPAGHRGPSGLQSPPRSKQGCPYPRILRTHASHPGLWPSCALKGDKSPVYLHSLRTSSETLVQVALKLHVASGIRAR